MPIVSKNKPQTKPRTSWNGNHSSELPVCTGQLLVRSAAGLEALQGPGAWQKHLRSHASIYHPYLSFRGEHKPETSA